MNRCQILVAAATLTAFSGVQRLQAQDHTAEVFGGYAYAKINPQANLPKQNAHGWMGGASGFANKWVGAGFEIAGQFGDNPAPGGAPPSHFKEYSYLVGPQVRFLSTQRFNAGAKILLGGVFGQARLDSSTTAAQAEALAAAGITTFDQTKFAMAVTFPVDVSFNKLLAFRAEPGWYRTSFMNDHQSNFRFTVGPVFRFGGK